MFDPKTLIAELRGALADGPLPAVVNAVADAFEAEGIRITLAAVRQGNATPLVVNRIRQNDVAGAALSGLGQKLGAWLTMQVQPKNRGPAKKR
jgi:hypothetical protein